MLPPRKLHLNIKFTTLSLTMIIKQPLTTYLSPFTNSVVEKYSEFVREAEIEYTITWDRK